MSRPENRDTVMSLVEALAVADTIKHGMPLSKSRDIGSRIDGFFDMAEAIVAERDRRYPQPKDA